MTDELEVLIRWEIGVLEDKIEAMKKDLRTLMIDRNTAALRVVAMEQSELPYPADADSLESWDRRVSEAVQQIKDARTQIGAWQQLLSNLSDPQVLAQVKQMIRTVELAQQQRPPAFPGIEGIQ